VGSDSQHFQCPQRTAGRRVSVQECEMSVELPQSVFLTELPVAPAPCPTLASHPNPMAEAPGEAQGSSNGSWAAFALSKEDNLSRMAMRASREGSEAQSSGDQLY